MRVVNVGIVNDGHDARNGNDKDARAVVRFVSTVRKRNGGKTDSTTVFVAVCFRFTISDHPRIYIIYASVAPIIARD